MRLLFHAPLAEYAVGRSDGPRLIGAVMDQHHGVGALEQGHSRQQARYSHAAAVNERVLVRQRPVFWQRVEFLVSHPAGSIA